MKIWGASPGCRLRSLNPKNIISLDPVDPPPEAAQVLHPSDGAITPHQGQDHKTINNP